MALVKQPVQINFAQGVDGKTDPYQVSVGKFLTLTNSIFTTAGRLSKRNGFGLLTTLPNSSQTTLTTLNDNLLATGSNLYAYSQDTNTWLNQGSIQPVTLNTLSLIRSSTSQSQPDMVIASNGLSCLVYVDNSQAYYTILDSSTGQQIIARTALSATATNPRVFLLGQYFVITYIATVSATPHLQYIAIPTTMPASPGTATDISTSVQSLSAGYDGIVANNNLFISWSASSSTIKTNLLTSTLVVGAAVTTSSHTATIMSVTADTTSNSPIIWVSFWDTSSTNGYSMAFDTNLNSVLSPTSILTSVTNLSTISSFAANSLLTVFYETTNAYGGSYPVAGVDSNFVSSLTITQTGTVTGPSVMLRSVGLASKPFILSSTIYMLVAYGEVNQPTYFLVDSSGNIYARLAYANGGGFASSQVLPQVTDISGELYIPYQIKDFITTVNKGTNLASGTPTNAIFTQTGINQAVFSINTTNQFSSEIASALYLTGGQLWEYDTVKPVEHGFHVWPEDIAVLGTSTSGGLVAGKTYFWQWTYEWTDNQGMLHRSAPSIPISYTPLSAPVSFTGNRTSGSPTLTSVSSFTGLQIGQPISGTGIPVNTYISGLNPGSSTVTMSQNASSGTSTSTTITPTSVSSAELWIPTLRLTYKVAPNKVRLVGYRWSTDQQIYYQTTSVTSPIANDTTVDFETFTDMNSDAQILGNAIIYTNGGVVENIAAPACAAIALFKNRVMLLDAEDRNVIWYSKQVIEGVPVEMSDLFTLYIAPTIGAQGSTGPVTSISAMDDKFIVFKRDAIYYITGTGPDNTGNNNDFSDPVFITSSVGCSNPNSIVLMQNGLMFQSDKGIWLLGRDLSTQYIGAPVENFNQYTVKSATNIPGTTQVRFVLSNNTILMYDYFYNQWGTFSSIFATAATLYHGLHTYINQFGQVFQETAGKFLDGSSPVLMSFTTAWFNVAGLRGFERFYFGFLLGTYLTPFKLAVSLAYDYFASAQQQIMVTPDNATPYYGGEPLWGSDGPWGGPGNVFQARIFPQKQKCQTFQLSVQEQYDPSLGVAAGEGLSLSGMNIVIGTKKGYSTQKASRSFG